MLLEELRARGLVSCPPFVASNAMYLTTMGSHAYGVADTSDPKALPDVDVYGFCVPPKDMVFPHLRGEIPGFGTPGPRFEQWQQHHVEDRGAKHDFAVFSIVRYFDLCMDGNPNMVDSLFTAEELVRHCTASGRMVRDRRGVFLSRRVWTKFRGYAYSQLHKMDARAAPVGKRAELVAKHGFDTKYAYHVVRLLDEAEQLLTSGTMDLRRAAEHCKAVRRGEVPMADIRRWFESKAAALEAALAASPLPPEPDEAAAKALLLECLEQHYGSLDAACPQPDRLRGAVRDFLALADRVRGLA